MRGESLATLREAHARGDVTHLRDARAELGGAIVEVVERCLARIPEERFETAGGLESALARILTGGSSGEMTTVAMEIAPRTFDFTAWRHARIAEWSRPRYRLDTDFVALTLLIDQGEDAATHRPLERAAGALPGSGRAAGRGGRSRAGATRPAGLRKSPLTRAAVLAETLRYNGLALVAVDRQDKIAHIDRLAMDLS